MYKWKFTIRIDIYIIHFRLGNMFYFNMQSKIQYLQFGIKRNISYAAEQKHISQLSAIDVYVLVKHLERK